MKECCSEKSCCPCESKHGEFGAGSCPCSCHAKQEGSCPDMTEYFLELADDAWAEVLKDEIKTYIVKTQGPRMKELAKIVAEGNNAKWKGKMKNKKECAEFKDELRAFFGKSKK